MSDQGIAEGAAAGSSIDEGAGDQTGSRQLVGLIALLAFFALLAIKGGIGVLVMVGLILVSVVIHEFGHYLTAKRSGMKVTEFFVGFGPRIWSFRRGETEYGVKPIWFGAYVKIIGMNNLEDVAAEDEPRAYRQQPFWQRLLTVLGGPLANIAFAFVLFTGLFLTVGPEDPTDWVVDNVVEGTAAAEAGILPGDDITSIGGRSVDGWEDLGAIVFPQPGATLDIVVVRDGEELVLESVIGEQLTPEAADALGLGRRDRLVAVDGEPITSYEALRADVEVGDELVFTIDRNAVEGGDRRIEVETVVSSPLPRHGADGFLGVGRSQFGTDPLGPIDSVTEGVGQTTTVMGAAVSGIAKIFSPSGISGFIDQVMAANDAEVAVDPDSATAAVEPEEVDGERVISVLGVVQIGAKSTEVFGIDAAIMLVAGLNVFLAILNLIPLLPFDGGHASIVLYEGVRSRITGTRYTADVAKMLPVAYAVVALFISLGLAAIFLDAVNPVTG